MPPTIAPVLVTVHDLHEERGHLVPSGTVRMLNFGRLTREQLAPLTEPEPSPKPKASTVLVLIAIFLFAVPATLLLKEAAMALFRDWPLFLDDLTMVLVLSGVTAGGAALVASTIVLGVARSRAGEAWTERVVSCWARHDRDLRTLDADGAGLAARLQDCVTVLNAVELTGLDEAWARGAHAGAVSAVGRYVDTRSAGNSPDRAKAKAAALVDARDAVEAVEILSWKHWCSHTESNREEAHA